MMNSTTAISTGLAALAGAGVVSAFASTVHRSGQPYLPGSALTLTEWDRHAVRAALRLGFAGLEVPVHVGPAEALAVGSGLDGDSRTGVRRLLLEPLASRVRRGRGQVYAGQTEPLTLLLNLRDAGADRVAHAYRLLDELLRGFPGLASRWCAGQVELAPVTVVLTGGNWPADVVGAAEQRLVFLDGTFADLGRGAPPPMVQPLVSEDWSWRFGWAGEEALPAEERHILRSVVAAAHEDGRGVRVTGGPTTDRRVRQLYWLELVTAGVDLIGTDQPVELARFLRRTAAGVPRGSVAYQPPPRQPAAASAPAPTPGSADPHPPAAGSTDGHPLVVGSTDGHRAVVGSTDGHGSLVGSSDAHRTVAGSTDGHRPVAGSTAGHRPVAGPADGHPAVGVAAASGDRPRRPSPTPQPAATVIPGGDGAAPAGPAVRTRPRPGPVVGAGTAAADRSAPDQPRPGP